MSDGPHKSLNMSRKWKRFAESAAKPAYSSDDVASRLCEGLGEDWRAEVPQKLVTELRKALEDAQPTLFGDHEIPDLSGLLKDPDCKGMGRRLVEFAQQALNEGKIGPGTINAVSELTLMDRADSRFAHVEEHYLRYADREGAASIRTHADGLVSSDALKKLAGTISASNRAVTVPPAPKRDTVDDGVILPP